MSENAQKRVFISWTGDLGKAIADYVSSEMFDYANLQPWLSHSITVGSNWFDETQKALNSSHYGVVCLTPGSSTKPWINFESGFLFGRLKNCKLITFDENLRNPLGQLQRVNGMRQADWVRVLQEMTGRPENECKAWVRDKFPGLERTVELRQSSPYSYLSQIDETMDMIQQLSEKLKKNPFARENIFFQQVVIDSFKGFLGNPLSDTVYSAPASHYPSHLISIQERLKPVVKAVALINIEEAFWQQLHGQGILRTTNEASERIFVFTTEREFTQMSETLQKHARRYNVYAMSLSRLNKEFSLYSKDFSIIENSHLSIDGSDGKILAEYDTNQEKICFCSDPQIVSDHESVFRNIVRNAVKIPERMNSNKAIEKIRQRIFSPLKLANYEEKTIEMSLYIDVEDYDQHEENHAYYREMMDRMLSLFPNYFPEDKSYRVLELGAGTGIFTEKLSLNASVDEIVAIEIDWHCYKKLKYRFRSQKERVKTLHEDSRIFDPQGKFDCIFSSFADHHIKEDDKKLYFQNIKRNLNPGGIVVVGDEFLREHDHLDQVARIDALNAYHQHIIDKAREDGDDVLVQLETQALVSGINKVGDFKVSCKYYEKLLRQAGFQLELKECIGPTQNANQIGGVYVYLFR